MASIFYREDKRVNCSEGFWTRGNGGTLRKEDSKVCSGHLICRLSNDSPERKSYFVLTQTRLCCLQTCEDDRIILFVNVQWKQLVVSQQKGAEERWTFFLRSGDGQMEAFVTETESEYDSWLSSFRKVSILPSPSETYSELQVLGEGQYCRILLCKRPEDAHPVAVKIVEKRLIQDNEIALQSLANEIEIQRHEPHPGVVAILEVHEDIESIRIFLEYCALGDLYKWTMSYKRFPPDTVARIMRQLLSVLSHYHSLNIAHRDIKLENILVTAEDRCKLSDFGLAVKLEGMEEHMCCGSPGYVAPEILKKRPYGVKVDLFSLGVVVFVLLSGKSPFRGKTAKEILKRNKKGVIEFRKTDWKSVPKLAIDLTLRLLNPNPDQRISASTALHHPWIQSQDSEVSGLLNLPSPLTLNPNSPVDTEFISFSLMQRNKGIFGKGEEDKETRISVTEVRKIKSFLKIDPKRLFEELRAADSKVKEKRRLSLK